MSKPRAGVEGVLQKQRGAGRSDDNYPPQERGIRNSNHQI